MSETSNALLEAIINEDIILESPNVLPEPINRRIVSSNKLRRNILEEADIFDTTKPIYTIETIHSYQNSSLISKQIDKNNAYLDRISSKDLKNNYSKVHIYRTISDILNLQNSFFKFDNVQIIGIFIYNKTNHCIQERNSKKIIKIDLNHVSTFPIENSIYLFYGTIKYESISNNLKLIPYISVKFFQNLPCPEKFEAIQLRTMKYRPREFDSVVSFDLTCNESNFDFYETISEDNENTIFPDFNVTDFINKIECDEIMYEEIERLMQINIDC